jgi:hypothetical protein
MYTVFTTKLRNFLQETGNAFDSNVYTFPKECNHLLKCMPWREIDINNIVQTELKLLRVFFCDICRIFLFKVPNEYDLLLVLAKFVVLSVTFGYTATCYFNEIWISLPSGSNNNLSAHVYKKKRYIHHVDQVSGYFIGQSAISKIRVCCC